MPTTAKRQRFSYFHQWEKTLNLLLLSQRKNYLLCDFVIEPNTLDFDDYLVRVGKQPLQFPIRRPIKAQGKCRKLAEKESLRILGYKTTLSGFKYNQLAAKISASSISS
ncbi:MAG: hypothetical protein IPP17_02480 [Bacteroidetes bacterium]|nr:hypothetical protein [Bacteroidota bacterium]